MRTTGRAYGCGTAKRRYRHRLPSPLCAPNNFLIRSSLLCEEADGWRCLAGWRLRCSRSCCARRPQTSQRRRILLWRSNHSHRRPMLTLSFPLLPSTSPHLGSSTRTPRSIRRKCRPRRLPQEQSTDWRKRRRTTHQREPRVKPAHSLAEAHHSSSMECSRLRSRWFRAMAVTELAQQDVSRTDYRAHFRLDTYRPAASCPTPFAPVSAGFSARFSSRFLKFSRPSGHADGTRWWQTWISARWAPGAVRAHLPGGGKGVRWPTALPWPWARSRRPAGLWRMVGEPGERAALPGKPPRSSGDLSHQVNAPAQEVSCSKAARWHR